MFGIFVSLCSIIAAQAQYRLQVWCPDNGDGTYTNPVLYADYSDPDVCAVGEDFYLTASSFNCIPGLPILHSKDLVNWQIVGHALQEQEPKDIFDRPQHGKGVWAPAIRHHEGEFYIYWGDPDLGIFMVKTTDPAGEWSRPVCVIAGKGMIDPCRELSKDGTRAVGQPKIVFDGGRDRKANRGWLDVDWIRVEKVRNKK